MPQLEIKSAHVCVLNVGSVRLISKKAKQRILSQWDWTGGWICLKFESIDQFSSLIANICTSMSLTVLYVGLIVLYVVMLYESNAIVVNNGNAVAYRLSAS